MDGISENIRKIIEAGIRAPSGENTQPWRFVVRDDVIELWNVPERDQFHYNYKQLASYIAHGAAFENMRVAAPVYGYRASKTMFPKPVEPNYVARIDFQKTNPQKDTLYQAVLKRATNRKPYEARPLGEEARAIFSNLRVENSGVELFFTEEAASIKKLAEVGGTNERVMLENRAFHDYFFAHLNWTRKEDDRKRYGFYIKTLELPPPAQVMFRIIKRWPVCKTFNKLGFAKMAAGQNAAQYAQASAIAVVTADKTNPGDFFDVGVLMERMWLEATRLGLSVQPLAGMLFMWRNIEDGHGEIFSAAHRQLISEMYQRIKDVFRLPETTHVAMMFRVGYGGEPTARATRYDLESFIGV